MTPEEDKILHRQCLDSLRSWPTMARSLTKAVRDKSKTKELTMFLDELDMRLNNHVEVFCRILDRFYELNIRPSIHVGKKHKSDSKFWD